MKKLLLLVVMSAFGVIGLMSPVHAATGDLFTTVSVAPATFYPLVHDNFRDTAEVGWETVDYTDVSIAVIDANGTAIRHENYFDTYSGSWSWDGTTDGGSQPRGRRLHS